MRNTRNQYRMLFSALLIAAFFLPAYSHISAFGFIGLAINAVETDAELTLIDLSVVLLPLLLIPFSAIYIFWRAIRQKPLSGMLLSLPFAFFLLFTLVVSLDISRHLADTGPVGFVKEMRFGFYLAALAAILLLFTYRKRKSVNPATKK